MSPRTLRDYEAILPGSADRLISLSERQQKHRARSEGLAQVLGFILTFGMVGLSAYAVSLGFAWESVIIINSWIVGVALIYIYNIRS